MIPFLLLGIAYGELILQDSDYLNPISLSSVQLYQVTDYFFHIETTISLDANDILNIQFPSEYESLSLSSCSLISTPKSNPIAYSSSCIISYPIIKLIIPVSFPPIKLTIILSGVQNPLTYKTTSLFSIFTTKTNDIRYTSQNFAFGNLAFAERLSSVLTANLLTDYSGFSNIVGEKSDYLFGIVITDNIDKGTFFRFNFPDYWGKTVGADYHCKMVSYLYYNFVPAGSFYCESDEDYVYLKGLSQNIKATASSPVRIGILITDVKNPGWAINGGIFSIGIDIVQQGTIVVLKQFSTTTPSIISGSITSISATPVNSLADPIVGNTISYLISFQNPHEIPLGSTIAMTLQSSSFSTSSSDCFIYSGISDSPSSQASCFLSSSQIIISNFNKIYASTTITIQVPISISTNSISLSVSSNYGASTIDVGSQVIITQSISANIFPSLSVSYPGSGVISSYGTFTASLKPTSVLPIGSLIYISFPKEFLIDSSPCSQTAYLGTGTFPISCEISEKTVKMTTKTDSISTSENSVFTLSLTLPKVHTNSENSYEICIRAISGSSIINTQCLIENVEASSLSSLTNNILGDSDAPGIYMPFTITFKSPITTDSQNSAVLVSFSTGTSGSPGFPLNLGIGTPNCKFTGTSEKSSCKLSASNSIGTDAALWLLSLGALTTNSNTVRLILKSPSTAGVTFFYQIKIGYIENRIFKLIGQTTGSTITVGTSPASWASSLIASRSSLVINESISLVLSLISPTAVLNNWEFYAIFPIGWDLSGVSSISALSSTSSLEVFNNDYAPIVKVLLAAGGISTAASSSLTINGLKNPMPVGYATGVPLNIGLIGASQSMVAYSSTDNLQASTQGAIINPSLTINPPETNNPGAQYKFNFTSLNGIPENGKIILSLSGSLTGLSTSILSHSFKNIITVSLSGNVFTLSNLKQVEPKTEIDIYVDNVQNPGTASLTNFMILTTDSSGRNIDSVTLNGQLTSQFAYGEIKILSISFEPPNLYIQNADFSISFSSSHRLAPSSTIQINIPWEFDALASSSCTLNYAISLCTASEHLITAVLSEAVEAEEIILLTLYQVFNIPNVETTSSFTITITNKNTLIDKTKATALYTFSPLPKIGTFPIESIEFYPKNQGVSATYKFIINLPVKIDETVKVVVWFPNEFDEALTGSQSISCWGDPIQLVGYQISCQLLSNRKLIISGFNEIAADLSISIYIGNIINPKGKIGKFRFALQDSNGKLILYTSNAGNLSSSSIPQPLKISDITIDSPYARILNNFTFEFEPVSFIPSDLNKGRIWVDFPSDYVLKNLGTAWTYSCSAKMIKGYDTITPWGSVKCINKDSNRIEISGGDYYIPSSDKKLQIKIFDVPGPQASTSSLPFLIKTYDDYNKILLDTTYPLLNYPFSFSLSLSGEEILINIGNSITIIKGTSSSTITAKTSLSPMRVNLQLTMNMPKISGARLHPSEVLTWPISQPQVEFTLSVPYSTTPGIYNLEWIKSGDSYDLNNPQDTIYADLGRTIINVIEGLATISISEITPIPENGHSLPIIVTLSNAPHSELIITPAETSGELEVSFKPILLVFSGGETEKELIIYGGGISKVKFEIEWKLSGNEAKAYKKPSNSEIQATGRRDATPIIANVKTIDIGQHYVTFQINTSVKGTLYYQLELRYTRSPNPVALVASYDEGYASRINLLSSTNINTITITNLAAETEYITYFTLVDTSDNMSLIYSYEFITLEDYQSILTYIAFNEYNPVTQGSSDFLNNSLIPTLAKAMAIHPSRVSLKSAATSRQLQSHNSNEVACYIANDKYADLPSPASLIGNLPLPTLNSYISKIGITAYSISNLITIGNSRPDWLEMGSVWSVTNSSITCAGALRSPGYIHMVILETEAKSPSPQQIVWGVDGENNEAMHAYVYTEGGSRVFVTYEGLDNDKRYDVYISASNDNPGNNKAVVYNAAEYIGVRTAVGDTCKDCDVFIVGDSAVWIVFSTGLGFLIVIF
ncbi:unnamed protein product [Blepharisma stoltei]|uniref:Uncharacterized protein n=1 Tax=Blepharisma stoltei TaxID=1481888 RepID=A0AAU9JPR8_9CILI|nr:unnamed protein product [Blepharisma stoltei]